MSYAERIAQLAAIFAIDVAAYATLSSHYHIVLRVDRDRAAGWSTEVSCGSAQRMKHSLEALFLDP